MNRAIAQLSDDELARLATKARSAEQDVQGGLIVGLLALIGLIVVIIIVVSLVSWSGPSTVMPTRAFGKRLHRGPRLHRKIAPIDQGPRQTRKCS